MNVNEENELLDIAGKNRAVYPGQTNIIYYPRLNAVRDLLWGSRLEEGNFDLFCLNSRHKKAPWNWYGYANNIHWADKE